ncbi:MAG: hypothetical protein IKV95_10505 [Brochothrix sp.]|uniref:hypothetical protein n=1 Tax=Brochothrix sp. TaxID=1993875 RepID=UPI002580E1A6|nr:hypothetical protein [Brochothrix sp.]MBR5527217.1 hypothetical protein [Brochothrix sp.]
MIKKRSVVRIVLGMIALLFLAKPSIIQADTLNEFKLKNGIKGVEILLEQPEVFPLDKEPILSKNARYIDYSATIYEATNKSSSVEIKYKAEAVNNSKKADTIKRTVTRNKFLKGSVSTTADFKMIAAKVGVKAEIGVGKSKTVTTQHTWTIPAKTKTTIKFGSKVYTTRGNIVRYDRGKVIKRKPVDAKYSHCEYTSKVSKKIK